MFYFRKDGQQGGQAASKASLAKSLPRYQDKSGGFVSQSYGGMAPTGQRGMGISQNVFGQDLSPLLSGFFYDREDKSIIDVYKDIYYYDHVCGAACDLMSSLPFSDFTLGGLTEEEERPFMESMERLNFKALFPELSVDYLVTGNFIATLLFDPDRKVFVDLIPQNFKYIDIENIPLYGFDPIITVDFPKEVVQFFNSNHPRVKTIIRSYGNTFVSKIKAGKLELDPISTIYLPRKTMTSSEGISFLRRILPIYFLEKNIFRGTLMESITRQRAILHVQAGTPEWEPTDEDLQYLSELFIGANADPVGSVVVTRDGIMPSEIRCLSGSTRISTSKGLMRIDQMVPHDPRKLKPGTRFDTPLLVKNHFGEFQQVDSWWYQGKKPTSTLVTSSGTRLACTSNHKFLTVSDGKLDLVKLKNISPTTWVLRSTHGEVRGKDDLYTSPPDVISRSDNQMVTLPESLTPELAYLLGMTISEGWIGKGIVSITNSDQRIVARTVDCIESVFNKKPDIRDVGAGCAVIQGIEYQTKPCSNVEVYSRAVVDFLEQLGVHQSKTLRSDRNPSYRKSIPECIFLASRGTQLAFIAGYIDGDGCIGRGRRYAEYNIYSTSKKILHGMLLLLNNLGYLPKWTKSAGETRITLTASDSARLAQELQEYAVKQRPENKKKVKSNEFGIPSDIFIDVLKSREIPYAQSDKSNGEKFGAFFINDDGCQVHVPEGWKSEFKHFFYKSSPSYPESRSYLLYDKLDNGDYAKQLGIIRLVSKRLYRTIQALRKMRAKFERVVSIIPGKDRHVYDLTMNSETQPLFLANGIITKNSGGDFWKVSELWQDTVPAKMRALGISDALLSGDASYNCVTGDTLIPTGKGILRIDEICDRDDGDKQDIQLTVGSRFGNKESKKWYYSGVAPTVKVTTETGNIITGTPEHPCLVLQDNHTDWKYAKDLQDGDLLCLTTKPTLNHSKLKLNLSNPLNVVRGGQRKELRKPEYMTPELAYIIGCIVSEGSIIYKTTNPVQYRITFSNSDHGFIERYVSHVKEIFNIDVQYNQVATVGQKRVINGVPTTLNYDCFDVILNSRTIIEWMRELGLYVGGSKDGLRASHYKVVPWSVLQADEESQLAFLAAYLEGDGSTTNDGITYTTASEELSKQIQSILNAHGYLCMRHLPKARNTYDIWLKGYDSYLLWRKIEPYMVTKKLNPPKRFKARNNFGFPVEYLRGFLAGRKVGRGSKLGTEFVNDVGDVIRINGWSDVTRSDVRFLHDKFDRGDYDTFLNHLKQISESEYHKVMGLFESRYHFVKVVSVEDNGEQHVYDLSMGPDEEPAFVANGIIIHNTIEAALSTFVDSLRSYRGRLTQRIMYDKVFPLIALTNDFYTSDEARKDVQRIQGELGENDLSTLMFKIQDTSVLKIPTFEWEKKLSPEGDEAYLGMLSTLQDMGLPIPLRVLAAAGGFNLSRLMESKDDDIESHKAVAEWKKAINELGGGDEDDIGGFASGEKTADWMEKFDSLMTAFGDFPDKIKQSILKDSPHGSYLMNANGRVPLKDRDFGESSEVYEIDPKTGKKRHVFRQAARQTEIDNKIVKASRILAEDGKIL